MNRNTRFRLTDRMAAVARLVPDGVTVCDVGCDHGFVAIDLVRSGKSSRVIAMDVGTGPLSRAREHIDGAGLSAYIETRLSDGLEKLNPGETECMIAAGMGGRLIVRILEDYPEKLHSLRYLVLQPQSEVALVRRSLRRLGFEIRAEDMVLEGGKFYPMMLAEAAHGGALGDRDAQRSRQESLGDEFGPCLMEASHPVLSLYLDWWEQQQKEILNQVLAYPERRAQVEEELGRIRDARTMMGKIENKNCYYSRLRRK